MLTIHNYQFFFDLVGKQHDKRSMNEFFACVLNLVNECDRRFEDANLKVETYMLSRLKSCTASLQLLENAMKNNNCVSHDKITKTLSLMLKLMNIWSKHSEYLCY